MANTWTISGMKILKMYRALDPCIKKYNRDLLNMNEVLEAECVEQWTSNRQDLSMPTETLVQLAIHGHHTCEEHEVCLSRKHSGDNACRCIRTVFATPLHYELYLELRMLVLEAKALSAVTGTTNEN